MVPGGATLFPGGEDYSKCIRRFLAHFGSRACTTDLPEALVVRPTSTTLGTPHYSGVATESSRRPHCEGVGEDRTWVSVVELGLFADTEWHERLITYRHGDDDRVVLITPDEDH